MEDKLMRPADVATRLGVSKSTVYILLRTGQLKSVVTREQGTSKTRTMVPEESVMAWEQRPGVAS